MRIFVGGALVAFLLATPAFAQTSAPTLSATCQGFAASPTLVDGATARAPAIAETNTNFQAWLAQTDQKLAACRAEAEAARAYAEAMSAAFNNAVTLRNTTVESWTAEVDEYNARANTNNSGGGRSR
jgi:hypothetical protein